MLNNVYQQILYQKEKQTFKTKQFNFLFSPFNIPFSRISQIVLVVYQKGLVEIHTNHLREMEGSLTDLLDILVNIY